MALFIVGSYKASPYDPDSAFDPDTHVATEASFIQLLEHGVYDSKYIGYKVQLGNSVDYNNGLWVIADVNHDSTNTGQTDCYDLISEDVFHSGAFGNSQNWRSSTIRSWLNATFIGGFDSIYEHLINPKYNSQGTWYTNDTIIIPSATEANISGHSNLDIEGVSYPIFTDNTSRIKKEFGGTDNWWWLRTRRTDLSSRDWFVYASGAFGTTDISSSGRIACILRVH